MDKTFKIGDRIIGNAQASAEYRITTTGWTGEVLGHNRNKIYVQEKRQDSHGFWVEPKYFDLYRGTSKKEEQPTNTPEPTNTLDNQTPEIRKVIFNNPATVVIWNDDTKTVVKCQEGDTFDKEKGLALCIAKKALGNTSRFNNTFKKWTNQ